MGQWLSVQSADERYIIKRSFDVFDLDKNQQVSADEFTKVLKKEGLNVPPQVVHMVFCLADLNGNGSLQKDEFKKFFTKFFQQYECDIYVALAAACDLNRNGFIERSEAIQAFTLSKVKYNEKQLNLSPENMTTGQFIDYVKKYVTLE